MSESTFPRLLDARCVASTPAPRKTELERALDRIRPELDTLRDDDLVDHNVKIPHVVTVAQAAVPTLRAMREEVAAKLPALDLGQYDKIGDYADALACLEMGRPRDDEPGDALRAMYDEALAFREVVVSVGRALGTLALLDGSAFATAGTAIGYRNVGYELGNLCGHLLERLPALGGRCMLTEEQLLRGKELATRMVRAIAARERSPSEQGGASRDRLRALTLLVRAYNEARRAAVYLRWNEGDADVLVPSFYAGRGRGSKSDGAGEAAAQVAPEVSPPAGLPSASPSPHATLPEAPAPSPRESMFAPAVAEPTHGA